MISYKYCRSTLIVFFIQFFTIWTHLFAETYQSHRFDDLLYKSGGGFRDWSQGRFGENQGWSLKTFLISRDFTQKGGIQKDEAGKTNIRAWINPELNFTNQGTDSRFYFLIAPSIQYSFQKFKSETRDIYSDGEALLGWERSLSKAKLMLEVGRGYQRSDVYGFIYSGFGNFAEASLSWNQWKLGLLTNKHLTGLNQGNFLQWKSESFLESIRFYHYQYFQNYTSITESQINLPKGSFQYRGFDLKLKFLDQFSFEMGGFQVEGKQKYSPNTIEQEKIIGSIGYGIFRKSWEESFFSLGGLYATRDKNSESKNDKTREGYNPILSDLRIFGGKSSFLINENISGPAPLLFGDLDYPYNRGFSNNGISLLGVEYSKTYKLYTFSILANTSYSGSGRGAEGILRWIFHIQDSTIQKGYISASVCLARVKPITPEKIYFVDWETQGPMREYFRIYLSMGTMF